MTDALPQPLTKEERETILASSRQIKYGAMSPAQLIRRYEATIRELESRPGARSETTTPQFHAGHAIGLHMVIELAKDAKLTGDELADANIRNAIARSREVQQWLEPLVHKRARSAAPAEAQASAEGTTNG